jgi:hypothetical protein
MAPPILYSVADQATKVYLVVSSLMCSPSHPISTGPVDGRPPHRLQDNPPSVNRHSRQLNGHTPPPFAGFNAPATPRLRCPQMESMLRSIFPRATPAAIEIAARGGLDHAIGLMSNLEAQPRALTFFRPPSRSNLQGFLHHNGGSSS